ncbi:hypothetical protein ACFV24_02610 [Nocardia fluminea]|uniref:hypothetical protein n=1 Tax=Nocardia fluminea TaxID=134984 RepID=UPI003670D648
MINDSDKYGDKGGLSASVSHLQGFSRDLDDIRDTFSSNNAILLADLRMSNNSGSLLESTAKSLDTFLTQISTEHAQVSTELMGIASTLQLGTRQYVDTDQSTAASISRKSVAFEESAGTAVDRTTESIRFNGLQLPTIPAGDLPPLTTRSMVKWGIELLEPLDSELKRAIDLRPAADFLKHLDTDWEVLQQVGQCITSLGVNQYVAAQNLLGGSRWLKHTWNGDASDSFSSRANASGSGWDARSLDLDHIGKTLQSGGICLERMVKNQVIYLADALYEPIQHVGLTFPRAVWARTIGQPMPASTHTEITTDIDQLKRSLEARNAEMIDMVSRIDRALASTPGDTNIFFDSSQFEIPGIVDTLPGTRRYGFGGITWLELDVQPPSR